MFRSIEVRYPLMRKHTKKKERNPILNTAGVRQLNDSELDKVAGGDLDGGDTYYGYSWNFK